MSVVKSKTMVTGKHLESTDTMPIQLCSGLIEVVDDLTYLGSNITRDGEVQSEVAVQIG